jgi:hypothetical protein
MQLKSNDSNTPPEISTSEPEITLRVSKPFTRKGLRGNFNNNKKRMKLKTTIIINHLLRTLYVGIFMYTFMIADNLSDRLNAVASLLIEVREITNLNLPPFTL